MSTERGILYLVKLIRFSINLKHDTACDIQGLRESI